ncbi:MAG: GWxTD domain-containing protein [Candidatus Aminicenantales bacterium]
MKSEILLPGKILFVICALGMVYLIASCRVMRLEKQLDPEFKEFYSQVRYIISEEEKKIFLELPASERAQFIEEFWRKRDPSPDTEYNEFKTEYLARIETVNRLFQGGGKPGYIQDRGRIYILLGAPDERYIYPVGKFSEVKSAEVWIYYRNYQMQLEFIDHTGDGEYTLEMPNTSALHEINKAQFDFQNPDQPREGLFDFNVKIKNTEENKTFICVEIPYKNIWLVERDEKLEATFNLSLKIMDSSGKEVGTHHKDYEISLNEKEVEKLVGQNYEIEIPFFLERGAYRIRVILDSKIEGKRFTKEFVFKIS